MNLYCLNIRYTRDAISKIMNSGEDREVAMKKLAEGMNSKILGVYGMQGQDHHMMIIVETPSISEFIAMIVSALLGGAIESYKYIPLYTTTDLLKASELYKNNKDSYSPPS
jgi:uncharacterized protein with GYD domain